MSGFGHFPAGIGAAVAIAVLLSGVASFAARNREDTKGTGWGSAVGLGLAYLVGHSFIHEWMQPARFDELCNAFRDWNGEVGRLPLFPSDAVDWLPWLAVVGMALGLLDVGWPAPLWARWENRILLTGLTLWLTLGPLFGTSWGSVQGTAWALGLGVGCLAFWHVIERRAEGLGRSMPFLLMLMASALSLCLALSGSILYGGLGGVLAAGCGGLWSVSWLDRRMNLSRSATPAFVIIFSGLVLCGMFYSELPRASALMLVTAPFASYIDRLGPVSRRGARRIAVVRACVVTIPLAGAVGLTYSMRPQ